jgi:hypothetical protein
LTARPKKAGFFLAQNFAITKIIPIFASQNNITGQVMPDSRAFFVPVFFD